MSLKSRLSKLEQRAGSGAAKCYEADLDAGVWREMDGGQAGQQLSEAEASLASEAGGLLLIGGKYLAGLDAAAL